ncbi:MAG: hypothetical protein FWD57_02550, partial [Polyangiaceae bacterium]|nr:hypothetical protein [Polyangiaceae bacterium]
MRIRFTYSILGIMLAMLWNTAYGTVSSDDDKQLLMALQRLRGDTIKQVSGGNGRATITIKNGKSSGKTEVSFRFSEAHSLAEYISEPGSRQPQKIKYLWDEKREIKYILPGGPPSTSVTILAREPLELGVADEIRGWSFLDLMEIPIAGPSEDVLFQALLNKPELTVTTSKAGLIVKIEIVGPSDPSGAVKDHKWTMEFDLGLGGALTDIRYVQHKSSNAKYATDLDQRMQLSWRKNSAGQVVPVSRYVVLCSGGGGGQVESRVEFEQFDVTPASASSELTFDSLGVAYGTPIVDKIVKIEWRKGDFDDTVLNIDKLNEALETGKAKAVADRFPTNAMVVGNAISSDDPRSYIRAWFLLVALSAVVLAILFAAFKWRRTRAARMVLLLVIGLNGTLLVACDYFGKNDAKPTIDPQVLNLGHVQAGNKASGAIM